MHTDHSLTKLLVWLLLLCGVLALMVALRHGALRLFKPPTGEEQEVSLGEQIRRGEVPIVVTPAMQEKLDVSAGFQHLVSYTDLGFEPSELEIKHGETIRFANNSSGDVWFASASDPLYPRRAECGPSSLDSCEPLRPMDFWEFTFDVAGEWEIVNNLDKAKGVQVLVE